ncbi:unnamed protein product [Chrysodeixis includens]|uniref:Uncharacterized protein n=1 Tax=Chrysodeixis includens TaxID=689277 RepID=A0A9N8PXA4_CHRIL|nr:unnamed protein product [Chrysodeixis includens]
MPPPVDDPGSWSGNFGDVRTLDRDSLMANHGGASAHPRRVETLSWQNQGLTDDKYGSVFTARLINEPLKQNEPFTPDSSVDVATLVGAATRNAVTYSKLNASACEQEAPNTFPFARAQQPTTLCINIIPPNKTHAACPRASSHSHPPQIIRLIMQLTNK